MNNHLRDKHPNLLKSDSKSKKKTSVSSYFAKSSVGKASTATHKITEEEFKQSLIELVVSTNQAFSLVGAPAFIKYTNSISSNKDVVKLPARKTLKEWITSHHKEQELVSKNILTTNEGRVSFILDAWTSLNQKSLSRCYCYLD